MLLNWDRLRVSELQNWTQEAYRDKELAMKKKETARVAFNTKGINTKTKGIALKHYLKNEWNSNGFLSIGR